MTPAEMQATRGVVTLVLSPDLIRCVYHFQYNARRIKKVWLHLTFEPLKIKQQEL